MLAVSTVALHYPLNFWGITIMLVMQHLASCLKLYYIIIVAKIRKFYLHNCADTEALCVLYCMCEVIIALMLGRLWMDGPMAGVVPDQVEQEVGNWLRALDKLKKGFVEVPAARKIAAKVWAVLMHSFIF